MEALEIRMQQFVLTIHVSGWHVSPLIFPYGVFFVRFLLALRMSERARDKESVAFEDRAFHVEATRIRMKQLIFTIESSKLRWA
eukprot:7203317-Pyramimonas_sp.AAC.1